VASTEAGERLLRTVAPRFEEIEAEVAALSDLRERPAGSIRITAGEHPAVSVLQPALKKLIPAYPDIRVEIVADYGLTDIVAQGYDAGVRLGEQVAKDMVAVRIGPDIRMAVVASPSYLRKHTVPQSPHDLTAHKCINVRLPTYGGLFVWEFGKDGREVKVRVDGQITVNNIALRRHPPSMVWVSRICRRIRYFEISRRDDSCDCLTVGARHFLATTSIIQADASTRRPLV